MRAQIVVLGSGAAMLASLRDALGPDVHLPRAVLLDGAGVPARASLPAAGAGVIDAGACCFEFIADVEVNSGRCCFAHMLMCCAAVMC